MERKEALEAGEEEEDIDAEDEGCDDENNRKGGKLDRLKHCHCSLFKPTPELLNYMSDGQPYHIYFPVKIFSCWSVHCCSFVLESEFQTFGEIKKSQTVQAILSCRYGGFNKRHDDVKRKIFWLMRWAGVDAECEVF